MLFTYWSAAFCSPQQRELASSADRFTVVRDQSVIKLLHGRLRGTIISGLASRQVLSYLGATPPQTHASERQHGVKDVQSIENSGTLVFFTAFMK